LALIILFSVLQIIYIYNLYVEKLENSIKVGGFEPTPSSLEPNYLYQSNLKEQQMICEISCDFIVFNQYSRSFQNKNLWAKTNISNYINYLTLFCWTWKGIIVYLILL